MDPRQRMLLETSWQALEDAGIDPGALRGGRAGVYAGLGGSEYRDVIADSGEVVGYLGTAASVAVGRIAFRAGAHRAGRRGGHDLRVVAGGVAPGPPRAFSGARWTSPSAAACTRCCLPG